MTVRFGVVGIDHLHLFELVQGLVDAGAEPVAHAPDGSLVKHYARWQTTSAERSADVVCHRA